MTRRLIVRAEAEAEIGDAALWYEHSEQGLGWAITSEVRSAINRIAENPFAYVRLRKRPDVRRALVHRFPYNVFCIVEEMPSLSLQYCIRLDTIASGEGVSRK